MPLYEYCCEQCGFRYEKIQKFDAEPEVACPKCGGALYRPLTAPALQFKGAGWYVNDYAPKAAAPPGAAPGGDAAKAGDGAKAGDAASTSGEKAAGTDTKAAGESKSASDSKPATSESTPKPATSPAK